MYLNWSIPVIKLALFSATVALMICCHRKPETTQPAMENITESVYASGIIKGANQYRVYSTVNGLIDKVLVSEGELVRKGTPVMSLVGNVARLNAENAELAVAYASTTANTERLDELKNALSLAKLKLGNEQSLWSRQKNLWAQKIGTRNEFEQRELNYNNALNAYETAKLRYTERLKQLSFQEQQSRKNLQIAKTTAKEYIVTSQQDGQVYSILKEPGEMVTPQSAVAIIGAGDDFLIEMQIDEYDIIKVKTGQRIAIAMDSYRGQVFEGEVGKIVPYMNEGSKSFTVEGHFLKKPETLYANLTCEANIIISQKPKTLTIPRDYLIDGGYVLVENNKKRKVRIGLMDYERVEIVAGLQQSEHIFKPEP